MPQDWHLIRKNNVFDGLQAQFIASPNQRSKPEHLADLCSEKSEAALAFKLHEYFLENLSSIHDLDFQTTFMLADMEINGIDLDVDYLDALQQNLQEELTNIGEQIKKFSKEEINLRSSKQVAKLLFEELNLPIIKKNKTGPSTDSSVLVKLARMNLSPVPELLIENREIEKLISTYLAPLPELVDKRSKKIHTPI